MMVALATELLVLDFPASPVAAVVHVAAVACTGTCSLDGTTELVMSSVAALHVAVRCVAVAVVAAPVVADLGTAAVVFHGLLVALPEPAVMFDDVLRLDSDHELGLLGLVGLPQLALRRELFKKLAPGRFLLGAFLDVGWLFLHLALVLHLGRFLQP